MNTVGAAVYYYYYWSGDRIPVGGARVSAPFQTGPGAYPASYTMGTRSWGKAAGAWRSPPTPI